MNTMRALGITIGVFGLTLLAVFTIASFCTRSMSAPTVAVEAEYAQHCIACGVDMQRGEIADVAHGNTEGRSYWHQGERRHVITCYRCPSCGILRTFAR